MAVMGNQSVALLGTDSVTSTHIASTAVGYDELATGTILQVVQAEYTTYDNSTITIAADDTIPQQSTEGELIITQSFTPLVASSNLILEWGGFVSGSGAGVGTVFAVFVDSIEDAIGGSVASIDAAGRLNWLGGSTEVAATNTTVRSYKLHYGPTSGTAYINGNNANGLFSTARATFLRITEVKA